MRKFLHGKRHFHANTDNRNRARAARFTRKMDRWERMIWAAVPVIHKLNQEWIEYSRSVLEGQK